jgi:hypothetical protein
MNIGVVILAFILAAGSILGILEAGAAHTTPFVDTYGNTTTEATNHTQSTIIAGTAPVVAFGTGAVIFLAVLVLFVAAMILYFATRTGGGRYSGRHG